MDTLKVLVKTLAHFRGDLPAYQSQGSSGFDLRAQLESDVVLKPFERVLVPTGLSFEIPQGFELQCRPRSGLAAKSGISVLNTPGTIDSDYRGEVKVILVNFGSEDFVIKNQDRIAQLVLAPVIQAHFQLVDSLAETQRGTGGFGSTGVSSH